MGDFDDLYGNRLAIEVLEEVKTNAEYPKCIFINGRNSYHGYS